MRRALACSCAALSACSVPIEHFTRPDAAAPDDASEIHDASVPAPFVPIHLMQDALLTGAPDLALRGVPIQIDTEALTIGQDTSPYFVHVGSYAVLFAGAVSIETAVKITGVSPLIVVASGDVAISARVDLGATKAIPGPGASGGSGAGGAGASVLIPPPANVRISSGGGGGAYGTAGGSGGSSNSSMIAPGTAGVSYGLQSSDALIGGGHGGAGGNGPGGGAGGGALQVSSQTSITIAATGVITAGGGGGGGGGGGPGGGGGGGAGGEILLEAPSLTVAGVLAANGGGGGGAGGNGGQGVPLGLDGEDGHDSALPASGGAGGIPMGSPGGSGAAGVAGEFAGASPGSRMNSEGGGGGGGAGRIWLRYRATTPPSRSGATISPPPGLDDTL